MTQPATLFGSCLATLPNAQGQIDLTPDMQVATGFDVLAQSLIRRQTTPRGSCLSSPNDCIDIRATLLSKGVSQSQLGAIAQIIRTELLKDQRVLSAAVSISLDTTTGTVTIQENLQSAAGPFTLTLTLTQSTVAFIVKGQ
jgi:hypothetical protein